MKRTRLQVALAFACLHLLGALKRRPYLVPGSLHGPYVGLPDELLQLYERQGRVTDMAREANSEREPELLGRVLYVVYSDSRFYSTRLRWVTETWGKQVSKTAFAVIGDRGYNGSDAHVVATDCPEHSHWEGACCKYSRAVQFAYETMQKDPSFTWAYFTDDDAYVRPRQLERVLATEATSLRDEGVVLANLGCNTPACSFGICAGGGYAASRRAVELAVGGHEDTFEGEQMLNCARCSRWADIAISQVFLDRKVEFRPMRGLYGWKLDKADFDQSLSQTYEPVMYHYMQSGQQMTMLHALFTGEGATGMDSLRQKADADELCAVFQGRTECDAAGSPRDTPWLEAPPGQRAAWLQLFDARD